MEINILDYLSEEEIKEAVKAEVRRYTREIIGNNADREPSKLNAFIKKLARDLAKQRCQDLIPNFDDLIQTHLEEELKTIKVSDLFWNTMGWRSEGNKMINSILSRNESLIEAKVKEIFK